MDRYIGLDAHASSCTGPPRLHKHRYYGVLAPRANLRRAVVQTAGPAGATLQLLREAEQKMGLGNAEQQGAPAVPGNALPDERGDPGDGPGAGAAGCVKSAARYAWVLLLVRIYECLPLLCAATSRCESSRSSPKNP